MDIHHTIHAQRDITDITHERMLPYVEMSFNTQTRALVLAFHSGFQAPRSATFSNIGSCDPIEFLTDMDWSYMKDQIFGYSARSADFLSTVASIRKNLDDPHCEYEMSTHDKIVLRGKMKEAMISYDGNDEESCVSLLPALVEAGFTDDTHHMIISRNSDAVDKFEAYIWDPVHAAVKLQDGLNSPFEVEIEDPDEDLECDTPEFN